MNRNLVILDPAHGGPDAGAALGNNVPEKFTTLALSGRLRNALASSSFAVIATRDADSSDPLTTDQRAEVANRAHPVACIVLHATTVGSGVHVYTSSLQPSNPDESVSGVSATFVPVPWDTAQAAYVTQSLHLANDLKSALAKANLPVQVGEASVRPLDNMMCPAVAIEIAPLSTDGGEAKPDTDAGYQQRVANAIAAALRSWRTDADAFAAPSASEATPTATHPAKKAAAQ